MTNNYYYAFISFLFYKKHNLHGSLYVEERNCKSKTNFLVLSRFLQFHRFHQLPIPGLLLNKETKPNFNSLFMDS